MPLYNRSTSLMSSGGITNRSGGNTQEIYRRTDSSTPQATAPEQSNSSGGGWLSRAWNATKNFVSNHSEGIGKAANVAASLGAAYFGGPAAAATVGAVKAGVGLLGNEFKGTKFGKLASGFSNEHVDAEARKAVDTLKNDKLDKIGKFKEISKQLKSYKPEPKLEPKPINSNSVLTNTSNGHVPVGYPASSEPSASNVQSVSPSPTSSSGLLIKPDKKKNKKKQWKNYSRNRKTKTKARKTRH